MAAAKCPKCGLMQLPQPTCKACGTRLQFSGSPQPARADVPSQNEPTVVNSPGTDPKRPRLTWSIFGLVLLLGLVGWAGFYWIQERDKRRQESESAQAALQALRALQSVTRAGLNYTQYTPRVLDTQVQVDRYIQAPGGLQPVKTTMRKAMRLYVFTGNVWSEKIQQPETSSLKNDPIIQSCPPIVQELDASSWKMPERVLYEGIPTLWSCASYLTEEAAASIPKL